MACTCPQCNHPVSWSRRIFGAHLWARWSCRNCGAELKWSSRHRWFAMMPATAAIVLIGVCATKWPVPIYATILIAIIVLALMILTLLIDRPEVVKFGRGVCILCGYHLEGISPGADGSRLCPECGAPNLPLQTSPQLSKPPEPRQDPTSTLPP